MVSRDLLTFSAIAPGLILFLSCLLPAQPTFASRNPHFAQGPENHSPAYKEGMEALIGGNSKKAAAHFKRAAADKPDDMWAFYYFGLCLLRLKRFNEAATAYLQAAALKPEDAMVHYQLGKTYLEMGNREGTEKEHRWLQEHDQELALYLSDLLPSDKPATQQAQDTALPSTKSDHTNNDKPAIEPMTKNRRPIITYREKAKYTEIARINQVQGAVLVRVVFARSGEMQDIRVIRGLPDGLNRTAIKAAQKIRFEPAIKDGAPVSVRGQLEFRFNLY